MNSVFKKLLFSGLAFMSLNAEARHDFYLKIVSVDQVLASEEIEREIEIEEDTFLHNIRGYACPLPGIQMKNYTFPYVRLEHREAWEFGVKDNNQALIVKKGDNCIGFPDNAQQIFGEEFVVGSKHKLKMKLERSIVTAEDWNGKHIKVLLETVSGNLLGVDLISTASVSLEDKEIQ